MSLEKEGVRDGMAKQVHKESVNKLLVRRQTGNTMTYPFPSATALSTQVSPAEDLRSRTIELP